MGALLWGSPPAEAQNAQSESFFAEGRKLRLAGNCTDAIVAFRRSCELAPERIGSLRNIAECEVELKKYAAARRSYWNLRRAAMESNDRNYKGWEKDAEKAYDALTPKVPHLTVKLDRKRDDVSVTVDGLLLDPRLIDVEVEQDQGTHTVEAKYGGVVPVVEKVTLAEGERKTIILRIPVSSTSPGDAKSNSTRSALFVSSIAGFTAGGLALVGMGISAGVRAGALSTIEASCPSLRNCDPKLGEEIDKGRAATTSVNVLAGIGAAGLVAGGGLFLASRLIGNTPAKAASPASVSFSVFVLPQAASVHFGGRF